MVELEMLLLALLAVGLLVGSWGILGLHARCSRITCLGRRLCFAAVIVLSGGSCLAALHCPAGLAPLGLSVGLLLVAMLWEGPERILPDTDSTSITD